MTVLTKTQSEDSFDDKDTLQYQESYEVGALINANAKILVDLLYFH